MRVIELPNEISILLNVGAWFIIHLAVSVCTLKLPRRFFERDNSLYRIRKWEASGRIWQQIARVKAWKHWIPDGTIFLKRGFNKSKLNGSDKTSLLIFIQESRRAELAHWLSMAPAVLFFLWNPAWAGWLMVVYALLFNVPIIIAQRYNRPRLQRLIDRI
ncbi:glycosyl-4,4'-diaponeurosporenoate acyltransferase [Paenibacillus agaridevorans]|uniref:glycosyl-4,4'-diaponeurosporenoate acyltransferase CrtO family protein n=1 Tax=Paenibacillus agaridevorans TaxID=171404 RepID=UPI001BE46671|nr:glycosyl-4,4'-diaponeurosporenoate acyltransferase [Paenibacillus agaridevorans]